MTSRTLQFPLQFLVFPGSTYGETGQVWSLGWSGAETGHEAPVRLEYNVSESKVKAPSLQLSKSLRVPLTPAPTASLSPCRSAAPTHLGWQPSSSDGDKEAGLGGGAKDRTAVLYVAKYF